MIEVLSPETDTVIQAGPWPTVTSVNSPLAGVQMFVFALIYGRLLAWKCGGVRHFTERRERGCSLNKDIKRLFKK